MNNKFKEGFEKTAFTGFLRAMGGVGKPFISKTPKVVAQKVPQALNAASTIKNVASSVKV